jgi:hypothetical protein
LPSDVELASPDQDRVGYTRVTAEALPKLDDTGKAMITAGIVIGRSSSNRWESLIEV